MAMKKNSHVVNVILLYELIKSQPKNPKNKIIMPRTKPHHRVRNEPDKALQFFIFCLIEQFSFKIFSYLAASKTKP